MADTYTKEELLEIYRGLPDEVKDALFSPNTTDIFDAIKEKQHLTDEQREIMSVYTGFLMMGVLPPEKYVPTLITKMGVEREKVASIAQTINRDLFNPIKDILKKVHTAQKNDVLEKPEVVSASKEGVEITQTKAETSNNEAKGTEKALSETIVTPRVAPMMMPGETAKLQTPRESTIPPVSTNVAAASEPAQKETSIINQNNPQTDATQPHIGSIFEQKLGGEFRLKSDAVTYTNQISEEIESAEKVTQTPPVA